MHGAHALLSAATAVEALLTPDHRTLERAVSPHPALLPFEESDRAAARVWVSTHLPHLEAAARTATAAGRHDLAWQLVDAMWPGLRLIPHHPMWVRVHREIGAPASRRDGARAAERRMLLNWAAGLDNAEDAIGLCGQVMASAERDGDAHARAEALRNQGVIEARSGDAVLARSALLAAHRAHTAAGDELGAARADVGLGELALNQDQHAGVLNRLCRARYVLIEAGDRLDAAIAQAHLSRVYHATGENGTGDDLLRGAADAFAGEGCDLWRARCLERLGELLHRRGRHQEGARLRQQTRDAFPGDGCVPWWCEPDTPGLQSVVTPGADAARGQHHPPSTWPYTSRTWI
ncbi:hypothetical protein ACFVUW_10525 [Streptomyces xiamenensis]|uniref:hypothetical protein n=1 Tax=Streptomyces xiamenensis TaxID=408015 RepID=UPI0036ED7DE1